jgi:hypothetical protein
MLAGLRDPSSVFVNDHGKRRKGGDTGLAEARFFKDVFLGA